MDPYGRDREATGSNPGPPTNRTADLERHPFETSLGDWLGQVLKRLEKHEPEDDQQAGHPRDQYVNVSCMRGCDSEYQTRSRNDSVVRTQHGRPYPANALCAVLFLLVFRHS